MILTDLYTINKYSQSESYGNIDASITLNSEHQVFKGHFPGNPILPGVCTLQIVKDLIKKGLQKECNLLNAGNIKYLGFINPLSVPEVQFALKLKYNENDILSCNAVVSTGEKVVCTFKADYKISV